MQIHSSDSVTRSLGFLAVLFVMCASACGGDDSSSTPTPQAGTGSTQASVLTNNAAGKACGVNKDCGSGTCRGALSTTTLFGMSSEVAPGGYCSFDCKLSVDCGDGGICIGAGTGSGLFGNVNGTGATPGMCLARCDSTSQCRDGYRCVDGLGQTLTADVGSAAPSSTGSGSCQVAPASDKLTGSVAGSECSADGDCGSGRCLTMDQVGTAYPGGYCTGRCIVDADCGQNAACAASLTGGAGTCYRTCTADTDCARDGYRCRSTANAAGGGQAAEASKRCLPGMKPLPDGITGAACTSDTDCGGAAMSCTTTVQGFNGMSSTTYPGGYCSARCVEDSDCGAGAACVGGFGAIAGAFASGTCYKTCAAVSDCREGYRCAAAGFGAMGGPMGMAMGGANQPMVCQLIPPVPADQDAGTR